MITHWQPALLGFFGDGVYIAAMMTVFGAEIRSDGGDCRSIDRSATLMQVGRHQNIACLDYVYIAFRYCDGSSVDPPY